MALNALKIDKEFVPEKGTLCTHCIICDAPIELISNEVLALEYGHHVEFKVCDECKKAIMYVKNHMEQMR